MKCVVVLLLLPLVLIAQPEPATVRIGESESGDFGYPTISDTSAGELLLQWGWVAWDWPGRTIAYCQRVATDGAFPAPLDSRETSDLSTSCQPRTTVVKSATQFAARLTAFP